MKRLETAGQRMFEMLETLRVHGPRMGEIWRNAKGRRVLVLGVWGVSLGTVKLLGVYRSQARLDDFRRRYSRVARATRRTREAAQLWSDGCGHLASIGRGLIDVEP